jgi:hypothetical protein
VLTLKGHTIAAMTFFADTAVLRHFGPSTDPAEPLRLVRYRDAADPAIHLARVQALSPSALGEAPSVGGRGPRQGWQPAGLWRHPPLWRLKPDM